MTKKHMLYPVYMIICIISIILTIEDPVFSSAGRTPTTTTTTTPKNMGRSTGANINRPARSTAGQSETAGLKEGDKIKIKGKLVTANGRFILKSDESGKEYMILENSALEKMEKCEYDSPGTVFIVTARITGYKNGFYIFVVEAQTED